MPAGMEKLGHKEVTAIELRYLGNSLTEIATKIETPHDTLKEWFKERGKLSDIYPQYVEYMNRKRQQEMEQRVATTSEEFFIYLTNVVRLAAQQQKPRMIPVVRDDGTAVANEDGTPKMVEVQPNKVDVADVERSWKMQRVMQGLPITYEKQDIQQTNFEADVILKELGLTDEDFKDENITATSEKIRAHLASK